MTEQLNNTVTSDNVTTDTSVDTAIVAETTEVVESTEAVKEDAAEVAKKDKTAKRFAELSKRENELRRKERSIKENITKFQDYEKAKVDAKKNPIAFVQQLTGMSFDDIINLSLTNLNDNPDPNKKIEEKLAALEKEREEEKEFKKKSQQEQSKIEHLNGVNSYIAEHKDEYEVILSHPKRGTEVYFDLLDQALQVAQRPLDGDEVISILNQTEKILTNEVKPLFDALSKSKKFATKVENTIKTEPEKVTTDIKTLTNDLSSASSTVSTKKMTDEERMAEIRRKFG